MEEQIAKPREDLEQQPKDKQEYQAPEVRDLGTVQDLTRGAPTGRVNDTPGLFLSLA